MLATAYDVLAAVIAGDRWPAAFAPRSRIQQILGRCVAIPAVFDAIGFEVRLAGGEDVDLGAAISAASSTRGILGESKPSHAAPQPLLRSPSWRRVRQFCARWATPASIEFDSVTHAFLEFDTSADLRNLADPSIFLGLGLDAARTGDSVSTLVANLLGHAIPGDTRRTLVHCIEALPRSSLILHVGVMFSRADRVRLHVCVPVEMIANFLDAIGLHHAMQRGAALVDRYGLGDPLATLQLEVGASIAQTLGVEFSHSSATAPEETSRLETFLDRLTETGVCKSDRRDALRAWRAVYRSPIRVGDWPCTIRQDISHVKLTLRPDEPPQAKAYLSVVPSFPLFGPK